MPGKFLDYGGKPVKDGEKDATWRTVISSILNATLPDEQLSGGGKGRCYLLTLKAFNSENPDYTLEERAFILERIKKLWGPPVVGRAMEFFEEGKEDPKPKEESKAWSLIASLESSNFSGSCPPKQRQFCDSNLWYRVSQFNPFVVLKYL